MTPAMKIVREICRPFKRAFDAIEGNGLIFEPGAPVAIKVTGGLGDHVIAARYVRDLVNFCGGLDFDIYSTKPDIAAWVFRLQPGLNVIYDADLCWGQQHKKYWVGLFVNQFVVLDSRAASWWKVNENRALMKVCGKIQESRKTFDKYICQHPYFDGFMAQEAVLYGMDRYTLASRMSGFAYGGHLLALSRDAQGLSRHGLAGRTYMTVGGGYDVSFGGNSFSRFPKTSTKTYPYFSEVIGKIRKQYPDLEIVHLGSRATCGDLKGVTRDLRDKTSLEELAEIIAGSQMHLDNEGGLVHVAAAAGTPSCVVFGPTPADFFGYAGNINIPPQKCGGCWWVNESWMFQCPKGMKHPECMYGQDPDDVAAAVTDFLAYRLGASSEGGRTRLRIAAERSKAPGLG